MASMTPVGCGIANDLLRPFPRDSIPDLLAPLGRMNRSTFGQLALLVLIAAAAAWTFTKPTDGRKIDLNPYKALGFVAADETSKLLGHHGSIILVIPDPGDEPDPVMEAQLSSFRSGLKEAGKVVAQLVETVKMDPFLSMRTGGSMPPEQFMDMLKRHPKAAAFVLFIGFPGLSGPEVSQLRSHPAKRIAISATLPNYHELIQSGALHMAIVPRNRPADEIVPEAKSRREAFDQEYSILRQTPRAP